MPAFQNFLNDDGQILTPKNTAESARYERMGYQPATVKDIQHDEVRKVYDNWYGAAATFGNGVLDAIPFAQTAAVGVIGAVQGDEAARDYAQRMGDMQEANPIAHFAGNASGSVLGGVGASKVANGVFAAAEGAGLLGMSPLTQGASTLSQIGQGAASNVALGAANVIDRAALAHAAEPGGQERIFAHAARDLMFDGIVGGAAGALPTVLHKIGDGWGDMAKSQEMRQGLVDSKTYATQVDIARKTSVGEILDKQQLWEKTGPEARAIISERLKGITDQYNQMKDSLKDLRMSPLQTGTMADELGTILGESHPAQAEDAIAQLLKTGNAPNIGELHALRQRLDSKINFGLTNELAIAKQQPLVDAREAVNGHLHDFLDNLQVNGGSTNGSWRILDQEYSQLQLAKNGLAKVGDASSPKGDNSWQNVVLATALGHSGIGKFMVAAKGAKKLQAMYAGGEFAKPAAALAEAFHATSDRMSKAVTGGLLGAAAETTALLHSDLPNHEDYDMHAAQVAYGMKDPIRASGGVGQMAMNAKLPDEMSAGLQTKAVVANGYLGGKLPKNPGLQFGGGMPSQYRPPLTEREKWMSLYNSVTDPSYAVLNPTQENMAAMQQFYPELYKSTTEAVLSQVQSNTDLPLAGQMWASRVLGYPVGGLSDPFFYITMKTVRMPKPAQKPATPSSGSSGTDVDSGELTKTQSLQQGK